MVIECESCGTRFNLADGQVPAQGARVRCSKCHHRFHVMPEGSAPANADRADMPELPADDTPHPVQAAEPAPAALGGDDFDLSGPDEPLAEEPLDEEPLHEEPLAAQVAEPEEELGADTPVPSGLEASDPDPPTQGALRDAALDNPEFLFDGSVKAAPALDSGFELASPGASSELTAPDPALDSDAIPVGSDDTDEVRAQAFGIEPSGASAPSESLELAAPKPTSPSRRPSPTSPSRSRSPSSRPTTPGQWTPGTKRSPGPRCLTTMLPAERRRGPRRPRRWQRRAKGSREASAPPCSLSWTLAPPASAPRRPPCALWPWPSACCWCWVACVS